MKTNWSLVSAEVDYPCPCFRVNVKVMSLENGISKTFSNISLQEVASAPGNLPGMTMKTGCPAAHASLIIRQFLKF